jgi:hypothetical protein
VAVGGVVVHAEVEGVGVREGEEVKQGAGAVVAVDAVGVPGRSGGLGLEGAFDRAVAGGSVDAAEPEDDG